jgi:hypothetical protein
VTAEFCSWRYVVVLVGVVPVVYSLVMFRGHTHSGRLRARDRTGREALRKVSEGRGGPVMMFCEEMIHVPTVAYKAVLF